MSVKNRPFAVNKYTAFLQKVNTHGFDPLPCWEWRGATKGNGYGHVSYGGGMGAHRFSYILFVSKDIPDGHDICHTCDNRFCVNPDHLFAATRKQNMEDMVHKGRGDGGNRKHLTEAYAQEIALRLHAGHSARKIATQMNINYSTVTAIKRGDSYGRFFKQSPADRESNAGPGDPVAAGREEGGEPISGDKRKLA